MLAEITPDLDMPAQDVLAHVLITAELAQVHRWYYVVFFGLHRHAGEGRPPAGAGCQCCILLHATHPVHLNRLPFCCVQEKGAHPPAHEIWAGSFLMPIGAQLKDGKVPPLNPVLYGPTPRMLRCQCTATIRC